MIESHFPCTTANIQRISTLLYIVTLCLKFPLILSPRLSQCDLIYISHNQLEIVVLCYATKSRLSSKVDGKINNVS